MPDYRSFEEVFGDHAEEPEVPAEEAKDEKAPDPEAEEAAGDSDAGADAGDPDHPGDDEDLAAADAKEDGSLADDSEKSAKAKKEEKPEPPRRHKVKIDGVESEVDEPTLIRDYQTAQASQKRFTDAKRLHEEATSFYTAFLRSPGDALVDLVARQVGDRTKARERVRDVFLEWLAPDLEESLITDPRERQAHQRERALTDREREYERKQAAERQQAEKAAQEAFDKQLIAGIEAGMKEHGLPANQPAIWKRIGETLDLEHKAGTPREALLERIPAAVKRVADERIEMARGMVSTLSPAELKAMFPEALETLKQERIKEVEAARAQKRPAGEGKAPPAAKPRDRKSRYVSPDKVFKT